VSSHEDQLASVTSLCKLEMKLLLNAKKSAPKVGFYFFHTYIISQKESFLLFFLKSQIKSNFIPLRAGIKLQPCLSPML
jgi:hypothetical protein